MRKFLTVIGLVILTLGLFIGAIMMTVQLDYQIDTINKANDIAAAAGHDTISVVKAVGQLIGLTIIAWFASITTCILAIANFFKAKVKTVESK